MTGQQCETCAHVNRGQPDHGPGPDIIRAQRLLLAVLNHDGDAAVLVAEEMHDCLDCRGRLLSMFLMMAGGLVTLVTGSRENAIECVEEGLVSDLDPVAPFRG
ncbi:hypothetical protein H7J86_18565 [Mycobacterium hackensackense]|uniref:hypothetical protein n=1 Tax=Mycobacterium hackensackense TaxID=228909 RepID=UPI002265C291|nr:hypothetical protein [Mycobacterium hackensackense]MCV7254168.1 hypothetical protein [Mycobacterium hackensackense]